MAKVPINDPKHWRERAEGARTLADQMEDQDARRKMLRIADDYAAHPPYPHYLP
jgi:hypothetical protein